MDQRQAKDTDWVDMSLWDCKEMLTDLFSELNPTPSPKGHVLIAQWVAKKNKQEICELIQTIDGV